MTEIVRRIALGLIEMISTLMLVRAILSWIPPARNSKINEIICMLTEPFIMPFRLLFDKLGIGQGFFIDLSFMASIITLQIIAALL